MSERETIPPNFVDPIMGDDICPELLLLLFSIQIQFDLEQRQLEEDLLNPTSCQCSQCWHWYWGRLDEVRDRGLNLQDLHDDHGVHNDINRYAPKIEEAS